jgi:dCMP deaminase
MPLVSEGPMLDAEILWGNVTPAYKQAMRLDKLAKYYSLAKFNAELFSKDPSTKVGAILLAPDSFEVLAMGYNGLPRGLKDDIPARNERPEKYYYYEHAERNAIYNAARKGGAPLEGAIAVVTMFPCADCARGLIQTGISAVASVRPDTALDRWGAHFEKSKLMLMEAGVTLILFKADPSSQATCLPCHKSGQGRPAVASGSQCQT